MGSTTKYARRSMLTRLIFPDRDDPELGLVVVVKVLIVDDFHEGLFLISDHQLREAGLEVWILPVNRLSYILW